MFFQPTIKGTSLTEKRTLGKMCCACWNVNNEHIHLQYFITFPVFTFGLNPIHLSLLHGLIVSQYLYYMSVIKVVPGFICLAVKCRSRHLIPPTSCWAELEIQVMPPLYWSGCSPWMLRDQASFLGKNHLRSVRNSLFSHIILLFVELFCFFILLNAGRTGSKGNNRKQISVEQG